MTDFFTNAQRNSKKRKYRKIGESMNRQEHTSINRDGNKNQGEHIHVKKNKEIAEKGHKVDEKISRDSHLIFDRDAILHKLFWIGKTLADIITRKILHESEFCSMYSCF